MKRYQGLAFGSGAILALMVVMNGVLGRHYGTYRSSLYIHMLGAAFAAILVALSRGERLRIENLRPWMALGGIMGVATTVCNNLAFGKISVTAMVALGLFGQLMTSLAIDTFGLFGMRRYAFRREQWPGLVISILGIALMMTGAGSFRLQPVLLSILAGVSIVLSRTVNARAAGCVGPLSSSLINHIAGLPLGVLLAILAAEAAEPGHPAIWAWAGGLIGVLVVAICNITVVRLSARRLTLLTFLGQVLGGIAIDLLSGGVTDMHEFTGGILLVLGMLADHAIKRFCGKKWSPFRRESGRPMH